MDNEKKDDWTPIKIPYKYVIEMFCDFVGASKAYNQHKPEWHETEVWAYWMTACKGKRLMHRDSEYLIEKLLWNYCQMGEKDFLEWYKDAKKVLKSIYSTQSLVDYEDEIHKIIEGSGIIQK